MKNNIENIYYRSEIREFNQNNNFLTLIIYLCLIIGYNTMHLEKDEEKCFFIMDTEALINQMDVIENCELISNVIVLQT